MLLKEIQSYTNFDMLAKIAKEGFIAGLHKSPFRGFSVEFAEHRPYNPGESIKNIDWKLLARTDKKYIKQFDEETNLKAHLWLDTSFSMYFPTDSNLKIKFGALSTAVMLALLQQQKDSFSLGLYNQSGFYYRTPCKSTRTHLQQCLGSLSVLWEGIHSEVGLFWQSHDEVAMQVGRRQLVVVLSDLLWGPAEAEAEASFWKSIALLRFQKCEVLLIHILHQSQEIELDFGNRPIKFIDIENQETIKLQPNEIQDYFTKQVLKSNKDLENKCLQLGVDFYQADVSAPMENILSQFFVKRTKMR